MLTRPSEAGIDAAEGQDWLTATDESGPLSGAQIRQHRKDAAIVVV